MEIRVVPNPYVQVDAQGRPAGILLEIVAHASVRDNPRHPNPAMRFGARTYVGARFASKRLTQDRTVRVKHLAKTVAGKFDHWVEHTLAPVRIVVPSAEHDFGLYYRRAVRAGDLFAADLETWLALGGKAETYQPPEEKLAQAKEGAIAQWVGMHGDEDPRLERLAMHWADKVAQRHPVGRKFELAARKAARAAAEAALAEARKGGDSGAIEAAKALADAAAKAHEAAAKACEPAPAAAAPVMTASPAPAAAAAPKGV